MGVRARDGLSMFMVDMGSGGLTLHRRRTMNGWTLGELHFDGVRVGPDCLLGQRDQGWGQLVSAVATEGGGMFHVGFARRLLDRLIAHVMVRAHDGTELADDPVVRDTVAGMWIELGVAERLAKRAVWIEENGEDSTVAAAMSKVYATELLQRLARVAIDMCGPDGTIYRSLFGPGSSTDVGDGRIAWDYLERVHGSIGGGTNEMKRTLIARAGVGLPAPKRNS